jgi:hypothetical protein
LNQSQAKTNDTHKNKVKRKDLNLNPKRKNERKKSSRQGRITGDYQEKPREIMPIKKITPEPDKN